MAAVATEAKEATEATIPCDECDQQIPFKEYQDHQIAHSFNPSQQNQAQNYINSAPQNNDNEEQNNDNDEESKRQDNDEKNYITHFDDSILDRAYGLCIGAGIGDSLGSYCEFRSSSISEDEMKEAMMMPGGGTWGYQVSSGQVTDDTELALCIHE